MNDRNRLILLGIVVVLIVGAIYYFESTKVSPVNLEDIEIVRDNNSDVLKDGQYPKAPELIGIEGYINTGEDISIESLKGKVVLVDFWTYTCINCIRTLPFLTSWDEKYSDKGLVIIGVHTPEFEFEREYQNVVDATEKYDIQYPVVQDNNYATWRNYNNRFWPRKYLIDSEGFIRYDHIGEGAYEETELMIQELLAEIGEDVDEMNLTEEEQQFRIQTTPELYAGYDFSLPRGQNIGNEGGLQPGETVVYGLPSELARDVIYLTGEWRSNADDLELVGQNGSIILGFQAQEINIVANNLTSDNEMEVFLNGVYIPEDQAGSDVQFDGERAFVVVDKPDLYNIYDGNAAQAVIQLVNDKGFTFNAFTFG